MASLLRSFPLVLLALPACSSESSATGSKDGGVTLSDGGCAAGYEHADGKCVEALRRYEPAERLDQNNVVSYGATPTLALPEPPKSGFRLVVPLRHLSPADEVEDCHAWAYPEFQNKNVYAARVYTTGALHHSNMYGVPYSSTGPSPYPACASGQGDVFTQVPNFPTGNIMDVLFANSTQIEGGEQVVFPPGMAFKLTTDGREIATTIHWLNTSDQEMTSEVVYDFFTMPDALVETEIVPFVFENQGFSIDPKSTGDITTTCAINGTGNIVSIMPHTHKRAIAFDVQLLGADGSSETVFHDGSFDTSSDITVFDQPVSLTGFTQIRHSCTVKNDLTRPIVWGTGDDEMCTLFGYMYPPSSQQIGYVGKSGGDCLPLDLGQYRK